MDIIEPSTCYVYIVTDKERKKFQVGVTRFLADRINRLYLEKTEDDCKYLVYYEGFYVDIECVKREMQLSEYSKRKLRRIIQQKNPTLAYIRTFQ